jgi:ABC-type nitrate/sulfonate/bicarbonate transport system substrate-binding protein
MRAARLIILSSIAGLLAQLATSPVALAAETITYLFPAPPSLPAFGPIRLAKGKGFAEAGIDVNFATGRGGVDVQRLSNLQDFYLAKGIIQRKSPVDELYTNQLVK